MTPTVPPWILVFACYVAVLASIWRARTDRRANGYIGHAIAVLWLGTVYLAIWLNLGGISDNQALRAVAVRLPVLLLIASLAVSDFLALWQARRARGRHG